MAKLALLVFRSHSSIHRATHGTDGTTSHPTKQPKDGCQVVGYQGERGMYRTTVLDLFSVFLLMFPKIMTSLPLPYPSPTSGRGNGQYPSPACGRGWPSGRKRVCASRKTMSRIMKTLISQKMRGGSRRRALGTFTSSYYFLRPSKCPSPSSCLGAG